MRVFILTVKIQLAIFSRVVPAQFAVIIHVLDVHCQTLQTIGQFHRDGEAIHRANLLKIGKLADLHPVQPDFPAQTPGTEGRRFPVILDKANIVLTQLDPDRFETLEIEVLDVIGAGLDDDLELVIVLQTVRVLPVSAVLGTPTGLRVGDRCGL